MRNMKDSGIEWIGKIPEDWEIMKMRYLGNFSSSGIDKKINPEEPLVKIINYTDVYGNLKMLLNNKDYMTVSAPQDKINKNLVEEGDLIFTPSSETIEDIGVSALINEKLENTSFSYHVLRFQFYKNINKQYKKYLCNNNYVQNYFSSRAVGSIRKTLNRDDFKELNVLIPPLEEQELIADYLDKKVKEIDNIISKTQETIEEYKKYKQSVITEAVTKGLNLNVEMKDSGIEWIGEIPKYWDIIPLKYLVGLNENSLKENTDDNYEFDYIDIGSVTLEDGIKQYQRMKFSESPSRARRKVKYKDVIVSTVRTYLKAISTIPDKENIIVSTGFAVLTPYNINHKYLGYFTKSNYFTDVVSKYSTGISYPAINSSQIVNFKILVPSEGEQLSIAHFLDEKCNKIDNLIKQKQEIIIQLESYKKSLIYEYVTGKKEVAVAYGY